MLGFNKKTQDASPQENTGGENKVFHFIKTHKKRCIAVVAAAAVLVAVIVPRKSRSASADLAYTQEKLGRRDIVNVYDGSGTINAADSYTVKSLVTGTVLTADFELGGSARRVCRNEECGCEQIEKFVHGVNYVWRRKDTNKPREKSKLACIFSEAEYLRRSQSTNKPTAMSNLFEHCRA